MKHLPLNDSQLLSILKFLNKEDSFAFFETTKFNEDNCCSFLFRKPVERITCNVNDDPQIFLNRAEEKLYKGYYLAGWFAYEFGYLLEPVLNRLLDRSPNKNNKKVIADLGVYSEPHIYNHITGKFSGAGKWPEVKNADNFNNKDYKVSDLQLSVKKERYLEDIKKVKEYIKAGDTYQVNYTLELLFDFYGSMASFYKTLRRNQNVSYGAFLKNGSHHTISFSPELFFNKKGSKITVRPMKGTMRRGKTLNEDRQLVDFLRDDIKNRSENVMIVDLLRNDLGRLSPKDASGNVYVKSLFDVETYETLHQMTSTIEAKVPEKLSLYDLFECLFPCGSVTGAPKIRTMEIIRELEKRQRGIYTGAIGYITPKFDALFNVPIRTVVIDEQRGVMGIGSGIVYDSEPENEWEECLLKGNFLTKPAAEFKLIETLLWCPDNGYWLFDLHMDRLCDSAIYFGYPFNIQLINKDLEVKAQYWKEQKAISGKRVRLTLEKDGSHEIIATSIEIKSSLLKIKAKEIIATIKRKPESLPRVIFSTTKMDSKSIYLYHKTTNRHIYDDEREQAVENGFYEVLYENEKNEVTEGSITNLFILKDNKFYTPPIKSGLLPGIFRRYFMEFNPGKVFEKVLTRKDLNNADSIFVGNSVRGLINVTI